MGIPCATCGLVEMLNKNPEATAQGAIYIGTGSILTILVIGLIATAIYIGMKNMKANSRNTLIAASSGLGLLAIGTVLSGFILAMADKLLVFITGDETGIEQIRQAIYPPAIYALCTIAFVCSCMGVIEIKQTNVAPAVALFLAGSILINHAISLLVTTPYPTATWYYFAQAIICLIIFVTRFKNPLISVPAEGK